MKKVFFEITFKGGKTLRFSSEIAGLVIDGKEYLASADGTLIHDSVENFKAKSVVCQFSTNTSTLIPALKVLGIPYHPYFDEREIIDSQNDITFYWKPSRLAAFYNRFSTDNIGFSKREQIVRKAVSFLIKSSGADEDFLPIEYLSKIKKFCKLLGFYHGFPIFDATRGMPKLLSRLGIHIGPEDIMVSTPMDKYANDIEEMASLLEKITGLKGTRKKNRVKFEKDSRLLKELKVGI